MFRLQRVRTTTVCVAVVLLGFTSASLAQAQTRRGLESNVLILEKAALSGCPGCSPDDPRLLIPKASAAIRIDHDRDAESLSIQVILLEASEMSVAEVKVDGVGAEFEEGLWRVQRSAKMKKAPKIEITCDDGQELGFKPQHRPYQGPVGGLIMPKSEDQPEAELSFHKKSFWADSLG